METKDVILIFLLVILIVVVVYTIFEIKYEGFKCIKNPIAYQLKDLNISCYCSDSYIINSNGLFKEERVR